MDSDRIKEIQQETAYPESVSVQQALLKVWNETVQEQLRIGAVSGSLPTPEQNKKAMLRSKIKFVNNMDKFSSRKNAYKQGWKDCYEWIMSQSNDR